MYENGQKRYEVKWQEDQKIERIKVGKDFDSARRVLKKLDEKIW